jgi:hypothetical protein
MKSVQLAGSAAVARFPRRLHREGDTAQEAGEGVFGDGVDPTPAVTRDGEAAIPDRIGWFV